jgi:hypothetical protein
MELLTALQLVAGDPNVNRKSNSSYYQDMLSWFIPFVDHPAVAHYKSINDYFCFDAPINSMLYMELGDELSLACEPSEYLCLRAGSRQDWMKFFIGLQDLARVSGFKEFFEDHLGYYQQAIAKVEAINGACDPASELESYLGLEADSYTLRFSPLQTCGYAGVNIPEHEGVSCTIGFDQDADNDRAEICLRVYLWHEFAHIYVNPIIVECMVQNSADWQSFEKFINSLNIDPQIYPNVNCDECFIRAITYKLNEKYYDIQEAEGILNWDEEQGFLYVRHFIKALNRYEVEREKRGGEHKGVLPNPHNGSD